ncbi:uncharacterized protein LOC126904469 [Daktulosphaira vitifoliae]|uniref:uncharacterized protein LOC126904469 n=1 Tax=Daktulosphaira vitifoliae TaxID=58002 RepID=UPI0021A9C4C9|nr:uncharacterized protein LOC126904469 [Daktulosphaira vitifoliae]
MKSSFAFTVLATIVVVASCFPWTKTAGKGIDGTKGKISDNDERFHLQSPDGQYVFGHTENNQGRVEMRSVDGTVTGYYSYIGTNGKLEYVNYIADKNGYRILSSNVAPSTSVKIEESKKSANAEKDFSSIFSEFIQHIKNKIAQKSGQQPIDPVNNGQQTIILDPYNPAGKDIPSSNNGQRPSQFPDWKELKTSSTQNPWDGKNKNEGQQQQNIVIPNVDDVPPNKCDSKGHSQNSERKENCYNISKTVPTKGRINDNYEDVTAPKDFINNKIISTTVAVPNNDVESTKSVTGETRFMDNEPTAVPIEEPTRETTVSHSEPIYFTSSSSETLTSTIAYEERKQTSVPYIEPAQKTTEISNNRGDIQETTESIDFSTSIRSININEDVELVDPTTIDPNVEVDQVTVRISSETPNQEVATLEPESEYNEMATTIGIQYATEENAEDRAEFRTLEPNSRIGTTDSPAATNEMSAQTESEIIWPDIPQQVQPIPQVLVPLEYAEDEEWRKNTGAIKSQNTRRVRRDISLN